MQCWSVCSGSRKHVKQGKKLPPKVVKANIIKLLDLEFIVDICCVWKNINNNNQQQAGEGISEQKEHLN